MQRQLEDLKIENEAYQQRERHLEDTIEYLKRRVIPAERGETLSRQQALTERDSVYDYAKMLESELHRVRTDSLLKTLRIHLNYRARACEAQGFRRWARAACSQVRPRSHRTFKLALEPQQEAEKEEELSNQQIYAQ